MLGSAPALHEVECTYCVCILVSLSVSVYQVADCLRGYLHTPAEGEGLVPKTVFNEV